MRTRVYTLMGWALLIPIVYLGPVSLARYAPGAPLIVGIFSVLALGAVGVYARTNLMDRVAGRLGGAAPILLGFTVALYTAVSVYLAHGRLVEFSPHLSQLGIFAQSAWTTLHGHFFANTHETVDGSLGGHFGIHFSPTLLLLVPLYAVWPSPLSLMVAQALALALAVLPLYLLLRPHAGSLGGSLLAAGLLGLPVMARAGHNDFHDATFLPVLLLTAVWALETGRRKAFLLAAVAALGVREDTGLTLAALGLYAGVRRLGWGHAIRIAALGLVWFLVVVRVVMPRFWSPGLWMDAQTFLGYHFGKWGDAPIDVTVAMLTHPVELIRQAMARDRLHYVYGLLQPMLLLPVLGSPAWIVGIPALAVNVLSNHQWMRQGLKYYSIIPILFAYLATARTAAKLARCPTELPRPANGLVVGLVVIAGLLPALFLNSPPVPRPSPPAAPTRAVLERIPPDVGVYAPIGMYPHLVNREYAACWESLGRRIQEPGILGRYDWIVLWPDGDPPDESRDAWVAEWMAGEPEFQRVDGFSPFLVYTRR